MAGQFGAVAGFVRAACARATLHRCLTIQNNCSFLTHNQLSGTIPNEFGKLSNLTNMCVGGRSSPVATSLTVFMHCRGLVSNRLSGTIPIGFFTSLGVNCSLQANDDTIVDTNSLVRQCKCGSLFAHQRAHRIAQTKELAGAMIASTRQRR
jgi:hypothetical protein